MGRTRVPAPSARMNTPVRTPPPRAVVQRLTMPERAEQPPPAAPVTQRSDGPPSVPLVDALLTMFSGTSHEAALLLARGRHELLPNAALTRVAQTATLGATELPWQTADAVRAQLSEIAVSMGVTPAVLRARLAERAAAPAATPGAAPTEATTPGVAPAPAAPAERSPEEEVIGQLRAELWERHRVTVLRGLRSLLDQTEHHWRVYEDLARAAGNPGFSAAHVAGELFSALRGGVFGLGTDEDKLFRALAGLNPAEVLAVRRTYKAVYHADLAADLAADLSGDAYLRALLLLDSNASSADAAALHEALDAVDTDEAAIFTVLRNRTPEQLRAIHEAYRRMYRDDLAGRLRRELDDWTGITDDTHDVDRAAALLRGDQATADAIAIDQQLHGFTLANVANVAIEDESAAQAEARDRIAGVYEQVRADVTAQAAREGWDTARMEAEVSRRGQDIERSYRREFGATWGSLRASLDRRLTGANLDLANALASNAQASADAARLAVERDATVYASDAEINRVLERQHGRALEAARRDLAPQWRQALLQALDAEEQAYEARTRSRWTAAERWAREQRIERQVARDVDAEAARLGRGNMNQLTAAYAGRYGGTVSGLVRDQVSEGVLGFGEDARTRAQALVVQGGALTRYQRLDLAMRNVGTRDAEVLRALEGATRDEVDELRAMWSANHRGELLDTRLVEELSGSAYTDASLAMMGAAESVADRRDVERRRVALEAPTTPLGELVGQPERRVMALRLAELESDVAEMQGVPLTTGARDRLVQRFNVDADAVQAAAEDHRAAVSEIADSVANTAAIAASILVTVAASALTGGALSVAAIGLLSSLTSSITSLATRAALTGNQYGHEELLTDLSLAVVDAVVSVATAGLGNRLMGQIPVSAAVPPPRPALEREARSRLREQARRMWEGARGVLVRNDVGVVTDRVAANATLARVAEAGGAQRLAAVLIAQTVENAVQAVPVTLAGNVINPQNWEQGNPFANIARGTGEQLGHGAAMGLAMSLGHRAGGTLVGGTVAWWRRGRNGSFPRTSATAAGHQASTGDWRRTSTEVPRDTTWTGDPDKPFMRRIAAGRKAVGALMDRRFLEVLDRVLTGDPELDRQISDAHSRQSQAQTAYSEALGRARGSNTPDVESTFNQLYAIDLEIQGLKEREGANQAERRTRATGMMRDLRNRMLAATPETDEMQARAGAHSISDAAAESVAQANHMGNDVTRLGREEIRNALVLWYRILGGTRRALPQNYRFVVDPRNEYYPRASNNRPLRQIDVGRMEDGAVGFNRRTALHEFAHSLEDDPSVLRDAVEFRDARARFTGGGEGGGVPAALPLRDLTGFSSYNEKEFAYPGRFVTPYAAKVYPGNTATEILSVGFEHFASPEAMLHLYDVDPAHFFFIMGTAMGGRH